MRDDYGIERTKERGGRLKHLLPGKRDTSDDAILEGAFNALDR